MTKQITVKQVQIDGAVQYRVSKTVDTTVVKIGELLSPIDVERYCHDRKYRVTVLPG